MQRSDDGPRHGRGWFRPWWLAFSILMLVLWLGAVVWLTAEGVEWTLGDLWPAPFFVAMSIASIAVEVVRWRRTR